MIAVNENITATVFATPICTSLRGFLWLRDKLVGQLPDIENLPSSFNTGRLTGRYQQCTPIFAVSAVITDRIIIFQNGERMSDFRSHARCPAKHCTELSSACRYWALPFQVRGGPGSSEMSWLVDAAGWLHECGRHCGSWEHSDA